MICKILLSTINSQLEIISSFITTDCFMFWLLETWGEGKATEGKKR